MCELAVILIHSWVANVALRLYNFKCFLSLRLTSTFRFSEEILCKINGGRERKKLNQIASL